MSAPIVAPQIDGIESSIARDLARKGMIAAPLLIVGVGLWRGVDAGGAAALALALVVANFLVSAAILGRTARRSPHLLMVVALGSFVGRLVLITVVGVGIKALDVVDWPVFCITLLAAYFGLLIWELHSVSLTLAHPGVKPRRDEMPGVDE